MLEVVDVRLMRKVDCQSSSQNQDPKGSMATLPLERQITGPHWKAETSTSKDRRQEDGTTGCGVGMTTKPNWLQRTMKGRRNSNGIKHYQLSEAYNGPSG